MIQPNDNSDHSWLVMADYMDDNGIPFADELRESIVYLQTFGWNWEFAGVGGVGGSIGSIGSGVGGSIGSGVGGSIGSGVGGVGIGSGVGGSGSGVGSIGDVGG